MGVTGVFIRCTNGTLWIPITKKSFWRTNETPRGVSFETCCRCRGDVLMGPSCYILLRCRQDAPIRRHVYIPLRSLGDVSPRRWPAISLGCTKRRRYNFILTSCYLGDPQVYLLLLSFFQVVKKELNILVKINHAVDTTIFSMLLYAQRKCKTWYISKSLAFSG